MTDVEALTRAMAGRSSPGSTGRRRCRSAPPWWDERLMEWTMGDEAVKVQLFRFIDVLPLLHAPADDHPPSARILRRGRRASAGLAAPSACAGCPVSGVLGRLLAADRVSLRRAPGPQVHRRLEPGRSARRRRRAAAALAGLHRRSARRGDHHRGRGRAGAGGVPRTHRRPEPRRSTPGRPNDLIDRDDHGPMPRVNVSVKLSALYSQFDPIDPDGTSRAVRRRLRPILRAARAAVAPSSTSTWSSTPSRT